MSIHTVAYYQAATANAALAAIPAVPDPTVRVISNDIYIPKGMTNIIAAGAAINSATATLRAQIQSPSLRATLNFDIQPIRNGLVFGGLPPMDTMFGSPLQMSENEPMEVWVQNGAAVVNQCVLWLSDGMVKPVNGKIYTVRATGAATLSAGLWVNTALTFSQTLPAGHYQCVGFRAVGANMAAARLFFVASPWRPGVLAANLTNDDDNPDFRDGNIGVIGEFDNTTPPTVDCLGTTDTTQEFFLDLIKVS